MEDNDTTSEVHGMSSDHETDDVRQPRMTSINHKRLYRCHECHYVTDRKNNLKRHVMTMHERCSKSLECCDDIFPNKASLREHVIESHKEGYDCRMCGRSFCRKALLKRHITVHSGQKDYVCELCGYATSHKSNLDRHKRRHLPKELRYQYFKSLPLVHSSPFIPPFTIPMNYKHFTDKYTGCVDQDRSSIVPAIHQQYNRVTMSQIYNIEDNRHKTQSNSACAASGPTQNNTSDIMAHNGEKHANQERPKIWNPAISDNYRYSSPVSDNYRHSTATSTRVISESGDKLRISHNECGKEGVKVRRVAEDQRPRKEYVRDGGSTCSKRVEAPEGKVRKTSPNFSMLEQQYSRGSKKCTDHKARGFSTVPVTNTDTNGRISPDTNTLRHKASVDLLSRRDGENTTSHVPTSSGWNYLKYPIPFTFPAFLRHSVPSDTDDDVLTGKTNRSEPLPASYKCPLCDVTFHDQIELTIHIESSHPLRHMTSPQRPITLSIRMDSATYRYY